MAYAERRTVKDRRTGKITEYFSGRWKKAPGKYPRVEGRFKTEAAAVKAGELLEAKLEANPRFVNPRKANTPLGVWALEWFEEDSSALSTRSLTRFLWRKIVAPRWEDTPIGKITWWHAKSWAIKLEDDGYTYDTAGAALSLLTKMLTGAVDAERMTDNPLAGRKRPPRRFAKAEKVWPTPEQTILISERCPLERDRVRVLMAGWLGMRFGELAALHRDNCLLERTDVIDGQAFTRRVVAVHPEVGNLRVWTEKDKETGKELTRRGLAPPKTHRGIREIDVPPFLVTRIQALIDLDDREYILSGRTAAWRTKGAWWHVMRSVADGRDFKYGKRSRGWEPILPGLTLHGCRHAHRTWMGQGDHLGPTPPVLIRERMGWSRLPGMDGIYAHPTPVMRYQLLGFLERSYQNALRVIAGQPTLPPDTFHDRLPGLSQEPTRPPRHHRIQIKIPKGRAVTRESSVAV